MAPSSGSIKHDLRTALSLIDREMADLLGVSRRTIQRLDKDLLGLSAEKFGRAAIAVFPKDRQLATRLAARGNTTLEQLGLVRAPAPQAPAVPAPAPAPISPGGAASVVGAAGDAMNLPPRDLRPVLLAAFSRAHALGLSVEAVKAWLEGGDMSPDRK
jgi:transcriptional regulator with XRE-family HTH domain